MKKVYLLSSLLLAAALSSANLAFATSSATVENNKTISVTQTLHKTIDIDGVKIFYREAGPVDAPTILLLHGFPTSSHMFRNLIPALADRYHLIAPDYPGFGNSDQPAMDKFDYTFDNMAVVMGKLVNKLNIKKYSVYLMDYGAPIGFRIASKNPERIESLKIGRASCRERG